jgi:SNF2 family DNA or RNA helicase
MDGTPITNGPFDIWSPINFLDPNFWIKHRFSNYYVFQHYFGNMVKKKANLGHEFEHCVNYRNLEELQKILAPISSRVTKAEVLKDLPEKLYSTRYFDLSPEQEAIYEKIEKEYMITLEDQTLTMELALTRLLRLQQVTCGYLPNQDVNQDSQPHITLPGQNMRLETLNEICLNTHSQGIVWARFTKDIDNIVELLNRKAHGKAVRYDGKCNEEERADAKEAFHAGKVQWFVGNPAVGGTGLTLTEAKTVIYYNNSFKLSERLQSEDRAHRIGQDQAVLYYDIAATSTVDEKIIEALKNKVDIANTITGDNPKPWIL